MDDNDNLDLTPAERDDFEGLSREREPPAPLEGRVVAALRKEQLLQRTSWRQKTVSLPIAAAAGFALFGVGAFAGSAILTGSSAATAIDASTPTREPPPGSVVVVWM